MIGARGPLYNKYHQYVRQYQFGRSAKADAIMVFQKGKVVETGSHSELIAKEGGVYRRLYDYQIGLH